MHAQVISEAFCESDMPAVKVAEMFTEADWDGSGRVRNHRTKDIEHAAS